MRKLIKPISIILTIAYLILIPFTALGATATNGSTGDTALFNKWKGLGLLDKSASSSELYQPIQKIDFVTFINDILKTSKQADIGFNDVPKDSWYGAETAKAVASGYVSNEDKTNFNPFSNITRLDAAIMVSKAFGLELSDRKLLIKITDTQQLDTDQLTAFGAVVEKGYISEISSGRYAPLGVLKLIDAIKMLDKSIGLVITKSGTITSDASGNMIINASSVVLKDMKIIGDLIISEGVLDGTVRLENVSVSGKMIVRGGGTNGITIKNSNISGNLIVEKFTGNVNVVAQGTTTIEKTLLKSGGKLSEVNLTSGKGFLNVSVVEAVAVNQTANLEGEYNNIYMEGSNINIKLNGKAENVNILKDTISRFSLSSGSAKNITTYSDKGAIELLGGSVTVLNVEEGAKGSKIDINGVTTVSKMNISDTTAINFDKGSVETLTFYPPSAGSYLKMKKDAYVKNVVANAAANISGLGKIDNAHVYANDVIFDIRPSSYYVASGIASNINGTIIDPTKTNVSFSVTPNKVYVQEGKTENLIVSGFNQTGITLAYISSDNSIATISEKGEVKGISTGTTKVHVTGQYPNYNTKIVDIEVIVASGNVTIPGTLTISPANGEAGKPANLTLTYTAIDNISNGTLIIKLPTGFSAYETDTVKIGTADEKPLDVSQRPNSQTISLTNIDLKETETIIVKLKNKILPTGDQYTFTAITDADGYGPLLPTSGDSEKAMFTVDSLRRLVEGINYSTPKPGSEGGTVQIEKLNTLGLYDSTKWLISVQGTKPADPVFDEVAGTEYVEYKQQGQNISVIEGQNLRLVAVDAEDKIKGFADITISKEMIRLYDADKLTSGNYTPAPGIKAGAVRINGLNYTNVDHWMYVVQDTAATTVFAGSIIAGAELYTEDSDISVYANQHIILLAVDSTNKINAYADISVNDHISKEATKLLEGNSNNYTKPEFGSVIGTTKIHYLNKQDLDIDKWMFVLLSKDSAAPGLNTSVNEFDNKYTDGNTFTAYEQDHDIITVAQQHLLLVGVKSNSTEPDLTKRDLIKAYVYLTIGSNQIRGASAPEIPDSDGVIGALVMGSKEFTTRISSLSLTGSAILVGAEKYMVRVQDQEMAAPQLDSILDGFRDYAADNSESANIKPASTTQKIVLIATDKDGRIKAYKNITVDVNKIKPANAPKFSIYQFIPGTNTNSTKIVSLPAGGPSGVTGIFDRWEYKIGNTAFDIPYKGIEISKISGTTPYTGGDIVNVSVNQHVLILAVDGGGAVLAYADETLNTNEIKQPQAKLLVSEPSAGFNYSIPEPGLDSGSTRIATLNNSDLDGASWYYKISSTPLTAPAYNSGIPANSSSYTLGKNVVAKSGDYFILLAVKNGLVTAYANILLTAANISLPALKTPDNYTILVGSAAGTTNISNLKFTNLATNTSGWKWEYAVGTIENDAFPVPAQGTNISTLTYGLNELAGVTTSAAININPNHYIMLLAVDGDGLIKGYSNIKVDSTKIKPADAPIITESEYTLEKGTSEGTTRFSKLVDLTKFSGATQWMKYVQSSGLTENIGINTSVPSNATPYNFSETLKPDIAVKINEHIILLAVDSSSPRKVKAYADIWVKDTDLIQTPFAMNLPNTTDNYTGPRKGTSEGTTNFTLLGTNVPDKGTGTIVWKYKTGTTTQALTVPHYNDDDTSYTACDINSDFAVQPNNWLLVVATIGGKVKAYFQLQISSSNIKPIEAPPLAAKNYNAPVAGSNPGTTKIEGLDPIDILGFAGWKVNVFATPQILMLGNTFTGQWSGNGTDTNIDNIKVKKDEYVVLAAVNSSGNVIAYKSIQITDASRISAAGFDNNYSGPEMGSVKGTTRFKVSLNGLDAEGCFVAKVVDTPLNLATGDLIAYSTTAGPDFIAYKKYISSADITAKPNQYVALIALDKNGKVLAYTNIIIPEDKINSGNAIELKPTDNYILETGTIAGTVRFTYLNKFGVPNFDGNKWIVQVIDSQVTPPILNTKLASTLTGYTLGSNIDVKLGKYVVLYAVDSQNAIKGYACIQIRPDELVLKSSPVPGTDYYTTKIEEAEVTVPASTTLKYVVLSSSAGVILKDSKIADLKVYAFGSNIAATENQYLLFAAVDSNEYVKAYKEIKITSAMLKNPNTSASLSGTLISAPISEDDIELGGNTLVITLDDGKWESDIATTKEKRESLFKALVVSPVVSSTETSKWTSVVSALNAASLPTNQSVITRTSDTMVTIELPAVTGYDITKKQTITLTIPKDCILGEKDVTAGQTITIESLATAKLTTSTTTTVNYTENDIRSGNKTLVVTLTGATWVDFNTNPTAKNALLSGLKADIDAGNQWASVIDKMVVNGEGSVTRGTGTQTNIVTIKLPTIDTYDIAAIQTISVTVPTSAAIGTSFGIESSGTVIINPVAAAAVPAVIQSVTSDANKSYKLGDTVSINVKFDQKVTVTGAPTLALQVGSTSKNATYVSGSLSDTLLFKYTVASSDKSQQLEYKAGSISGTIVNTGSSTAVNKTLPAIGGGSSLSSSNIAIDGVIPQFVSTYPKAGTRVAVDEADVLVKLTDTDTIYYVVVKYDASNVAPSVVQIKDGTANTTVVTAGNFIVPAANTEYPIPLTTLTDNKGYTVYMYAEDGVGNKSSVTSLIVDNKPPEFTVTNVTPSDYSISLVVNTNEVGNIYAVALPDGSAAPTSLSGYTAAKVTQVVTADTVNKNITLNIAKLATSLTGAVSLVPSTNYDIYVVCEDASKAKNLTAPFKVDAKTTQIDLTKVDVDLAKSMIINANTLMEYSLDTINWKAFTSSTETILYNADAAVFVLNLREILDKTNSREIVLARGDDSVIDLLAIDYDIAAGTIKNNLSINLQYRLEGGTWKALNALTTVKDVVFVPGAFDFRTAATSAPGSSLPSPVKTIYIANPMSAPELVYSDEDNTVTGLNSSYQYSIDGASWVNGSTVGNFSGTKTVRVRDAATPNKLPSETQTISFTANSMIVKASPGADNATTGLNFITITFEENTNKKDISVDDFKLWFTLPLGHLWGDIRKPVWNTAGNVLTVEFNGMGTSTMAFGDQVNISADADIKKAGDPAAPSYISKGNLTGSFNTVPKILSIKAQNNKNTLGFTDDECIVITFDQATNQKAIESSNIADYLILKDSTGKVSKDWNKDLSTPTNLTVAWTAANELTITFHNVLKTDVAVNCKVTVNPAWGLKDAANTTEPCTLTTVIGGSFTSTPIISSVQIDNKSGGTAGTKEIGDTITITFNQATNKKAISSADLVNYFKLLADDNVTYHSWGSQSNIKWVSDTELVITLTSTVGLTLKNTDSLVLSASAGIKAADGGTAAVSGKYNIDGNY